jgi:hypothetical protein
MMIAALLSACAEYDINDEWWSTVNDGVPPDQITSVKVENREGEVYIMYEIPANEDFIAVRAVYETGDGIQREKYASKYIRRITVDGFIDTKEREVKLYSVDKAGNMSEPVVRPVQPLPSSIFGMRSSLSVTPTWNGVAASWENKNIKNMAMAFYIANEIDEYILQETYYSNSRRDSYVFSVGEEHRDVPTKIRIELFDHYNVYAEPFDTTLIPIREMVLPGLKPDGWKLYGHADGSWKFRGDYPPPSDIAPLCDSVMTGEDVGVWLRPYTRDYVTAEHPDSLRYMPNPMYLTIDLGKEALISQFVLWLQAKTPLGSQPWMSTFEIWGSNNPKPVSSQTATDWAYWTGWQNIVLSDGSSIAVNGTDGWMRDGAWDKLADCQYTLPSGYTTAREDLSTTDQTFLRNGVRYPIDMTQLKLNPYRYLRLRITRNSGGADERELALAEWIILGNYR